MRTYCFRRCISISHSNNQSREHIHSHTIEVAAFIKYMESQSEVIRFREVENLLDDSLAPYQKGYLNDMEGFERDASIEHLGEVLFYHLYEILNKQGLNMERFEISETPLRTYIISSVI